MKRSLLIPTTLAFLLIGAAISLDRNIGIERAIHITQSAFAATATDVLDPPPTTHAVFSKMLQGVGISNPSGEITSSDVFGDSPKNLYVYTYQQIFERPDQDALLDLAGAYGLTVVDAQAVLRGSVAPLMRGKINYTQDKAIADVNKIQKSYSEILRQRKMKYDLQLAVLPTEIFSNGNLDDSGFDLINDLNLIEEVLFVDKTKVYLNQQPFGPKSASISKSVTKQANGSVLIPGSSSGVDLPSISQSAPSPNPPSANANTAKTFTLDDILKGSPASGNPLNYCASGSPLNKALDQYAKDQTNFTAPSDTSINNGDKTGGTTAVATAIENIDVSSIMPPELALVTAKSKGVFTPPTDSFCNEIGGTLLYTYRTKIGGAEHEIFCLSLEKKIRTYTSFSPTKSCIQCAVAAMNESMKKLLSKNITPNKLTGNTYESTKCKSAIQLSDRLNMNIIMIPTPIITPNKYGPFVVGNMTKRINAYIRNYLPYGNPKDSPPERIKDEALANLGPSTDQVNVIDEIQAQLAINRKDIVNSQAMQPIEETSSSKNASYQQMIKEMRQMTSYFQSFQDIFTRLGTNAKGICDKNDINS